MGVSNISDSFRTCQYPDLGICDSFHQNADLQLVAKLISLLSIRIPHANCTSASHWFL